jgi:hypothetical protein
MPFRSLIEIGALPGPLPDAAAGLEALVDAEPPPVLLAVRQR